MTTTKPATASMPLELDVLRAQIDGELEEFLEGKAASATEQGLPEEITETLRGFVTAGGKRIRPLLCVLGWYACDVGKRPPRSVIRAAASLELFHAAVLIHDDIIDDSATRRNAPTAHRILTARHSDRDDPVRCGHAAALVLGDLAMVWSVELLNAAALTADRLGAALAVLDRMRAEVMYGQYLDLLMTGRPSGDLDTALAIIRYKTVTYTCQGPLSLGAVLAGAPARVIESLAAYARPLGEAFQLRDDLLGVFGDPARTGKSSTEDLREGKHTALVSVALQRADPEQLAQLRALIGNPAMDERDATICRDILRRCAKPQIEQMIHTRCREVRQTLRHAPFPADAVEKLQALADSATARDK